MAKKETTSPAIPVFPMLKTVEQMSKLSVSKYFMAALLIKSSKAPSTMTATK